MDTTQIDRIAELLKTAEANGEKSESIREVLTLEDVNALRAKHPGIPEDYLAYLQRIGAGSLLFCSYAVYSSPIKPEDVFGEHDESWPSDLIVFGDNFSGDLGVFEPSSGWAVGELWHDDRSIVRSEMSFASFMEDLIINLTRDV